MLRPWLSSTTRISLSVQLRSTSPSDGPRSILLGASSSANLEEVGEQGAISNLVAQFPRFESPFVGEADPNWGTTLTALALRLN